MIIFEITKPGNSINHSKNSSENFKLNILINHLIATFFEANVALNLYIGEKLNRDIYFHKNLKNREFDRELKRMIRKEIELEYANNNNFEQLEEINYRVELEFKRRIWNRGLVPSDLKSKIVFIHAKTFLFALDNFEKQFNKLLKNESIPKSSSILYTKFLKCFPNLRELRNSAHHQEDRIRGEKFGKKIDLKPVSNNFINAPNGGVLMTNILNGDNYGGTLGDGTFGEVEISVESMNKLQTILQEFINSLDWKGHKEHLPN